MKKKTAIITLSLIMVLAVSTEGAYAAEGYDTVASSGELSQTLSILKYGMLPVYGRDVKDGEYEVKAYSSSVFFHIDKSELKVKNGKMSVKMTLSSTSYEFLYLGTAEKAAAAPLEDYIEPHNHEGWGTFEFDVEALDKEIDCAAYSKRKKQWYPRKILFEASSLPEDALKVTLPDYDRIEEAIRLYDESKGVDTQKEAEEQLAAQQTGPDEGTISVEPVSLDMKDGEYSIQVHMTGGSGRAGVTSPTWLIVKDGKAYARLLWSSIYYDYMLINGKKYMNETTDGGNSTFTVPITVMDSRMPVIADTTAMGDPVEIEYTLTFYENTIGEKNQVPQEAAINVLVIAAIIIAVGGVLNFIVKRKRKQ